jgi:hypothetical protein
MSIMAMKNKALTLQSKHINAQGVFSLHGKTPHAPRSMGRLRYPTSMKGQDPQGYGGGSACRVGGRFARACGSSTAYPPLVHASGTCPCDYDATVKRAVMTARGKLVMDRLACKTIVHRPPVKQKCTDHYVGGVDKPQKPCGPYVNYVKEIGVITYDTRLLKLKECLVDVADPKYHQC